MRVKCPKCGKSFDYEKHDGVCPHCAVLIPMKPEIPMREKVSRKKRKIPAAGIVLICLIVIYFAAAGAAQIYGRYQALEQRVGYLEPTAFEVNETIIIDDAEIVITEVDWNPEPAVQVPDGYKLLRIHYIASEDFPSSAETLLSVDGQYMKAQLSRNMKVGNTVILEEYLKEPREGESNLGFMVPARAEDVVLLLTDEAVEERYALKLEAE